MTEGKKNWIAGVLKSPTKGALNKPMHVESNKKIPLGKINKTEKSTNPLLAKRANLAETLGKLKK